MPRENPKPTRKAKSAPDHPAAPAAEPTASPLLSPRTFLKAARPERFSDSVRVQEFRIPRTLLEYQLESITSRSQEGAFEQFARKLAEREVCPNLLPHTGPTGGGDSKVDSETYPVADQLALAWYVGTGRSASNERWAFAFSAKREWKPKARSDIAKIAATGRGYKKAIFVSNQYVPDKERAKIEDELRQQHGLDVRIFDRTWILDRVYEGRHEQLAIDELAMDVEPRHDLRLGPRDAAREQALKQADESVDRAARQGPVGSAMVHDMLYSATLARSLERPRTEVEGRLARARAAADELGSHHLQASAAYQEAFTAFFWFEDYPLFLKKLGDFDALVRGSDNSNDLQNACTLFSALWTGVTQGLIDPAKAELDARRTRLLADLDALAANVSRPSAALDAEGMAIQVRMTDASPADKNEHLAALRRVIDRSAGLLGFPMAAWVDMIVALGEVLGDLPAYEDLHAATVSVASQRQGEVAAAQLLLKRGAQHLDADRPYDAIKALGQALTRLFKEESREDLMQALYLLGAAYEQVGLLWAARGSLLTAASVAADDLHTSGTVTHAQRLCFDRLRWVELRLGRVPHALAWHEVTLAIKNALAHHGADFDMLREGDAEFDGTFGILLLRTDHWELKRLESFPDLFDRVFLPWASATLRFLLGHGDTIPGKQDDEPLDDLFQKLADQPAAAGLPAQAELCAQQTVTLRSRVLGCEVQATTPATSPCLEVAESILAAFESFLSTGLYSSNIVARTPSVSIAVQRASVSTEPMTFEALDREGLPHFDVRVGDWNVHEAPKEQALAFGRSLVELLATMLFHAYIVTDPDAAMLKLAGEERAMERAVHFTSSIRTVSAVLGNTPKTMLDSWAAPDLKRYALVRQAPWKPAPSSETEPPKTGQASSGQVEAAWKSVKHTDVRVESLIRPPIWERAKWWATCFLTVQDDADLPILAPVFRNPDAAAEIFTHLRRELGDDDPNDRLRVSIVRGTRTDQPHAYKIVIGSNFDPAFNRAGGQFVVMMSRINEMTPPTSENLERFLKSYETLKGFILCPAAASGDLSQPKLAHALSIRKKMLHAVDAWRVAMHEPETAAIQEGDSPIIPPEHQTDAPVLEVLRRKEEALRTPDAARWTNVGPADRGSPPTATKVSPRRFKERKKRK